jgi:hypothetical protein
MTQSQILLAKSLEAAALRPSVDSFEDRLILQKSVYILQSAGIQMGYRFRWYLKGPYSPDMTADAFALAGAGAGGVAELSRWKLDEPSAEKATKLQPLLAHPQEDTSARAKRLELLGSLLFLLNTRQATVSDPNKASQILNSSGKPFSAVEVSGAITELREYGLIA